MSDQTIRLDEIRARAEAATSGKWEFDLHGHTQKQCRCLSCIGSTGWVPRKPWPSCDEVRSDVHNDDCYEHVMPKADADFITHSRADVLYLLDLVVSLITERDTLRAAVEEVRVLAKNAKDTGETFISGGWSVFDEIKLVLDGGPR